jgi:hypothetical protein
VTWDTVYDEQRAKARRIHNWVTLGFGLLCILVVLLLFAFVPKADKPDSYVPPTLSGAWHQPYGGCKEAYNYPGTPGYRQCRAHGFPVRP